MNVMFEIYQHYVELIKHCKLEELYEHYVMHYEHYRMLYVVLTKRYESAKLAMLYEQ